MSWPYTILPSYVLIGVTHNQTAWLYVHMEYTFSCTIIWSTHFASVLVTSKPQSHICAAAIGDLTAWQEPQEVRPAQQADLSQRAGAGQQQLPDHTPGESPCFPHVSAHTR